MSNSISTIEMLDVVNGSDEVIGQRTRTDVHLNGLLHRAIHILVFNKRGEIYLQKRSETQESNPGLWDSAVAGHVLSKETYDACAIREAAEEIGLQLRSAPDKIFKIDACVETEHEFSWIYRVYSEGPFELDPIEVADGAWHRVELLDRALNTAPKSFAITFHTIWREYSARYRASAR